MMRNILLALLLISLTAGCSQKVSDPKPDNSIEQTDENPFEGENPTGCIAIDTDGDGIIDCKDDDMDNDGRLNEVDAFPKNHLEWIDTDGDVVGDNTDWSPTDPTEWNDNDGDAIGDNADEDDDNDGIADVFEIFYLRFDANNWTDIDSDSYGDQTDDEDKDNDGIPTLFDDLAWNKYGSFDIDNDYDENDLDSDMDGDGHFNSSDAFPHDVNEWYDDDLDRLGNNVDPDDDGDGFPDTWEDFPRDGDELFDTDGDGYSNTDDDFPYDPFEWIDSDGDGIGDNSDPFPNDSSESKDTDGDGIGNNSDSDIDNDGFFNCVPYNPNVVASCNIDLFPLDKDEWADNDLDTVGDNSDADDDNDGIPDLFDDFPLDKLHFSDYDKDRIPDSTFPASVAQALELEEGQVFFVWDADTDNDGAPNVFDDLPWDRFDYFDIDGDRIGNKTDLDDDGDGVADVTDLFPYDSTESVDFDEDAIGDSIDADDDGDGFPDLWDVLAYNRAGFSDFDEDGRPDQGNLDIDGDALTNDQWECNRIQVDPDNVVYDCGFKTYTLNNETYLLGDSNTYWCDYPKFEDRQIGNSKDLFIWDENEKKDDDFDCLGDNLTDADDDNDGVPDIWDDFPNDYYSDKELGYFDIDGDGVPSFISKFDKFEETWSLVVKDDDIDGDGVPNFGYDCKPKENDATIIQCLFVDVVEIFDPESGEQINTVFYDAFPYNSNENRDEDKDGIGNNSDPDADQDGIPNCVPIDLNSTESCNQDKLPLVGQFHSFISEEWDIDPNNIIPYCADYGNCYYINYDRDEDGLTDYEEYLFGTNPVEADTDGDTVPDITERDDQTDPLDPNDWLDEDLDGIPNYYDKTPRGAYDEESLREQITNSNSCRTKISEEICVDSQTDLCQWNLTGETTEDPDTGEQIPVGECIAKEILITEDINITDCFNIDGDFNINTLFFNTVTIDEVIADGPRCSGDYLTVFNLDVNSNMSMKNINIYSSVIDRLIYSEGKNVSLENVSTLLVSENNNNVTVVEHFRPTEGNLEIKKSSLRSIMTSVPEDMSPIIPILKADVTNMILKGNIINCDIKGTVDEVYNFNCIESQVENTTFEDNNLLSKGDSDNTDGNNLSYAWKHNSLGSTDILGDNFIYSSLLSLDLTGSNYNINNTNLLITEGVNDFNGSIEAPYGKYYLNGSNVNVDFYKRFGNTDLFANNINNELFCSTFSYDPQIYSVLDMHPLYRNGTPINNNFNLINGNFFNNASVNKTPNGNFTSLMNFDEWKTLTIEGVAAYNYDLLGYSTDEGGYITLIPSDPDFVGMGKRISNLTQGKRYDLSINVKSNTEEDRNIKMRAFIYDGLTNEVTKSFTIQFNPDLSSERIVTELGDVVHLIPFSGNTVSEKFIAPSNEIYIKIENSNIIETETVRVYEVKLLEADVYQFQYSGANIPFCNL